MTERKKPLTFAPVVDIFPQLVVGFHDRARVQTEMDLLKSFGFDRVYFVVCNPGYPLFSNPMLSLQRPHDGVENYALASLEALGDPNQVYVECCHAAGMAAIAVMKPYEGGGGASVPHGQRPDYPQTTVNDPAGERFGFDSLIQAHPELRVKRLGESHVELPIDEIKAVFLLPEDYRHDPGRWELYYSLDNGSYCLYDGGLTVTETVVEHRFLNSAGEVAGQAQAAVEVVLSDFTFPAGARFAAMVAKDSAMFTTMPVRQFHLYHQGREIDSSATIYLRKAGIYVKDQHRWGMESHPAPASDFEDAAARLAKMGFELEWYGNGWDNPGWISGFCWGIAAGKLEYLKGTLCEGYESVRDYWLGQVDQYLKMGYDGIDFRLQNHSSMICENQSYGGNEPLLAAYRQKFGGTANIDALKMMEIRGDFYLKFLRRAAEKIHKANKKMIVHLRHANEVPSAGVAFNELGFWAMPKVYLADWRSVIDLADEITLKDYYFNDYRPDKSQKMKAYANSLGKPVWVHCYIAQGKELNDRFIGQINADPAVGGVLLYEVANANRNEVNSGLIEQYGDVALVEPATTTLRQILQKYC